MSGAFLITVVAAISGILAGWLIPIIFRSRRPYGLWGDVLVSTVVCAALAYIEWVWILPAIGFQAGWIAVAAAIGDPLGLAAICLWLMRRIGR